MNIVLFNRGKNPEYIKVTLSQIKKYNPDINLFFISNDTSNLIDDIYHIKIDDLNSNFIEFFNKSDFYINHTNPLWRTSIERFFYIHRLVEKLNLTNIFHFDNDVLIYDSFENVISKITYETNLITPSNENNLVCGMFYTKNLYSLYKIINSLYLKIRVGQFELESRYKNRNVIFNNKIVEEFHLNEMTLLKIIQEEIGNIFDFPIMPHYINYNKFDMCFDPSSWGQYICTYDNHSPNYYSLHHYIGRYIYNKTYDLIFENRKPFIVLNNQRYKLFNLHVHSKKLIKWI